MLAAERGLLLALGGTLACAATGLRADEPFLLGADVSFVASRPELDQRFTDGGRTVPEILILKNHGWNAFRLRLFAQRVEPCLERQCPLRDEMRLRFATHLRCEKAHGDGSVFCGSGAAP